MARLATMACIGALAFFGGGLSALADEQGQIDFANGLFGRGFYAEAAEEYQSYLETYPSGSHKITALYRLAESFSAIGNYRDAALTVDRLLMENPPEDIGRRGRLRRGVALYHLKRHDEGAVELGAASAEGVAEAVRAEALYYLGKLHFESGRGEAAARAFHQLVDLAPDNPLMPYGRYQLAFVYLSQNELERAATEFSTVAGLEGADGELRMECRFRAAEIFDKLGWFDAAVETYEQLTEEFPGSEYARRAAYGHTWALYHSGHYEQASAAAERFLNEHPESPLRAGVMYLRGNCLQHQNQYEAALNAFQALLQEDEQSEFAGRAQYKIAWVELLRGRPAEAESAVRTYLAREDGTHFAGEARFLLANILFDRGQHEQALEQYRKVVSDFSDSEFTPEALYRSAECLTALNRPREAGEAFEQFAAAHPANPLATEAVLRAGDAEFLAGDFARSVENYQALLASGKAAGAEEQTLYRLALAYHNLGDLENSAKTFTKLLEKYPESDHAVEAGVRVGDYLLRDGKDPLQAIAHFEAAHQVNPTGPHAGAALRGLALARFEAKDYEGAAQTFSEIVANHPSVRLNGETYAWLGQYHFDREEWTASAQAFEALLKSNPNYPNQARVLYQTAQARGRLGETEQALVLYRRLIESAPDTMEAAEAQYHVAELHESLGEVEKAMTLYEAAASSNTGDTAARARFRLGELHEAQGSFVEAARSFMRVAILFLHEDLSPEALLRAGRCFEQAGEARQARQTYRELISEFPESTQARDAREKLGALDAGGN